METSGDINLIAMIGLLAGGLALFLFGLQLLTDALKSLAGARLETILGTLSANRFRGMLAGAGITALMNSSTITTVLLVGFVSAGLMTLAQTVPMIMGANIGSTLTAQIIAFDVSVLTPFMLALGFFNSAFARRETARLLGSVVLGLGLLFLGIQFMGDATRPLRTFQPFIDAMQDMRNPWLGILVGAVFTAIVQSSAATLAIIIALGSQGLMPLEAGIALILGANVGTCGTALLASVGKCSQAAQVGVVHLLFNVFGVLLFVFFIPEFAQVVRSISPSAPELQGVARLAAETPRQVANAHTLFSVIGTGILIWFAGPIARLAQWLVPTRDRPAAQDAFAPRYLDPASLEVPALALQRTRLELVRMGEKTIDLVRCSVTVALGGDVEDLARLIDRDKDMERLSTAILAYLGQVSRGEYSDREGAQIIDLIQITTSMENIGEIAMLNLVSVTERRLADRIDMALCHDEHTAHLAHMVLQGLESAVAMVGDPDPEALQRVVDAKEEIETLAMAARNSVVLRLRLDEGANVPALRLATDMIVLFQDIGRLSRAIARSTRNF